MVRNTEFVANAPLDPMAASVALSMGIHLSGLPENSEVQNLA
jgi:hypothetical protein